MDSSPNAIASGESIACIQRKKPSSVSLSTSGASALAAVAFSAGVPFASEFIRSENSFSATDGGAIGSETAFSGAAPGTSGASSAAKEFGLGIRGSPDSSFTCASGAAGGCGGVVSRIFARRLVALLVPRTASNASTIATSAHLLAKFSVAGLSSGYISRYVFTAF